MRKARIARSAVLSHPHMNAFKRTITPTHTPRVSVSSMLVEPREGFAIASLRPGGDGLSRWRGDEELTPSALNTSSISIGQRQALNLYTPRTRPRTPKAAGVGKTRFMDSEVGPLSSVLLLSSLSLIPFLLRNSAASLTYASSKEDQKSDELNLQHGEEEEPEYKTRTCFAFSKASRSLRSSFFSSLSTPSLLN